LWDAISNWTENGLPVLDILGRLSLATVLGLAVGIERERREHAAGMRTHAVVSVASALIMIVSAYGFPEEGPYRVDPMRLSAQVVSGIGFLGAGVIIFRKNAIHGLTTAASVWAVAGIGLAVGGGMPITATIGTGFLLLIQAGLRPVKKRLFEDQVRQHHMLLSVSESKGVLKAIRKVATGKPGFELLSINFDDSSAGRAGLIQLSLEVDDPDDILMIVQQLQDIPGVDQLSWRYGKRPNGRHDHDDNGIERPS
jgi:putative Mg2+ transporter-C (MgtC) family protein